MAWDPITRTIIAPVNRIPAIVRLVPRADFATYEESKPRSGGDGATRDAVSPCRGSFSWRRLASLAWRRHGENSSRFTLTREIRLADDIGGLALVLQTDVCVAGGALNLGGPVATSTGLVFIGATIDPFLRAFETQSGRQVWQAQLPTARGPRLSCS